MCKINNDDYIDHDRMKLGRSAPTHTYYEAIRIIKTSNTNKLKGCAINSEYGSAIADTESIFFAVGAVHSDTLSQR